MSTNKQHTLSSAGTTLHPPILPTDAETILIPLFGMRCINISIWTACKSADATVSAAYGTHSRQRVLLGVGPREAALGVQKE